MHLVRVLGLLLEVPEVADALVDPVKALSIRVTRLAATTAALDRAPDPKLGQNPAENLGHLAQDLGQGHIADRGHDLNQDHTADLGQDLHIGRDLDHSRMSDR